MISKDEARTKHWRVAGRKPALAVDSALYNWRDGNDGSETFDPYSAFNNSSNSSNSSSNNNNNNNNNNGAKEHSPHFSQDSLGSGNSSSIRHINSGLSHSSNSSNGDDNYLTGTTTTTNNNNKYLSSNVNDSDRTNLLAYNGPICKRHSTHAVFSFTDFDVCVDEMDLLIENSTNAFLSVFKS